MTMRPPLRLVASQLELPEDGRKRAEQMLRTMARHVAEALQDERWIAHARQVTSDGKRSTAPVKQARLALAAAQRLRYTWDPLGVERMQTPLATRALGVADCNSNVVYFAALTSAVGIPTQFLVTKVSRGADEWGHVYALVEIDGAWYAADPSPVGLGSRAIYLPLGRQPIEPIEPLLLDAADPSAPMRGLFSKIKDVIGDVFEGVRDLATLKHLRKALRWGWAHMPKELRPLVMKIGPMVAGMFLPGGQMLASAALSYLEADRVSRKEKKRRKAEIAKAIAEAERQGLIAPGIIDPNNDEHLFALAMAGQMPPDVAREWYRQRGLAPPKTLAKSGARPGVTRGAELLPLAALALLPFSLPLAAVTAGAAAVTLRRSA